MNDKGQSLNSLIYIFIAVIVGVILFQAVAQQVGTSTNTVTINSSQTLAANGESIYLTDYRALSGVTIVNSSDQSATVGAGNYTVTNNVVYNGALAVKVTTDDAEFAEEGVYIQGTAQPLTYIDDAGGRSMALLVVIFFALAVAVVALSPVGSSMRQFFGI